MKEQQCPFYFQQIQITKINKNTMYKKFLRSLLFCLDEELSHHFALFLLKTGFFNQKKIIDPRLSVTIKNIKFENPLGLAAGFDKNAEIFKNILGLGFGFCEIGTVTPYPQAGNLKPRLFRLIEDQAIINKMGFNNKGHEKIYERLKLFLKPSQIVGINIGANKDSKDRVGDYKKGLEKFYSLAKYFTINISSPNTPGLRSLQEKEPLQELLKILSKTRQEQIKKGFLYIPIFLKIAPDLLEADLEIIAEEFQKTDLDGMIISNTTIEKSFLKSAYKNQEGGLSGVPLFERSTIVLAKMRKFLGSEKILIGVGGVSDAKTFLEKIKAGADLVQLYSALIFEGPKLANKILTDVIYEIEKENISHIRDYRNLSLEKWASKSLL